MFMLRAIALEPIWDDAVESLIEIGKQFSMSDSRVESLAAIGAARIISESEIEETVTVSKTESVIIVNEPI
jgi:hypothetical protein